MTATALYVEEAPRVACVEVLVEAQVGYRVGDWSAEWELRVQQERDAQRRLGVERKWGTGFGTGLQTLSRVGVQSESGV
uniref:Uncharacterized protein n=1 Tax=Chromera velia CCMP2878 TaxID=1169474 RepID=A0A0G4H5U5_9ALVE|eukprot:Cvel_24807.t1-p1 / transcript=Cvel_24807.t1 / gene=Cvel_24807 / organism=Chromera_velia_CCMP2878 / gene_product=hypothetical protein / transcript_product=hypothetical protein / location=Cvel_scaffold2732:22119-23290(+) / protein_length=78 / sequence_SO=supercontig / SO=protein_coding / is_pseudo=false